MDMSELIIKLWPILTLIVGVIIWLIRLEAKVLYADKDLGKLELKVSQLESEASSENLSTRSRFENMSAMLMGIKESLARIEGRLSHEGEK